MKAIVVVMLVVLCGACGTTTPMKFTSNMPGAAVFERRTSGPDIKVFFNQQPNDAYESLGFIEWSYYQPGMREPVIGDVLQQLKEKASAVGGDAFVVRSERSQNRTLYVFLEVIRFRR